MSPFRARRTHPEMRSRSTRHARPAVRASAPRQVHLVSPATIAILAYIEELRKGNYEHKRELREGDELKSIMDALHTLAKELNQGGGAGGLTKK